MRMRAYLVDDEPLAIARLTRLLEGHTPARILRRRLQLAQPLLQLRQRRPQPLSSKGGIVLRTPCRDNIHSRRIQRTRLR